MTKTDNALVFAPEDILTERIAEPQVRALSWYPRLMTEGPNLVLTPAIFWLVASLKPDRAVVLGLGQGHLFFSVAQGLDKLVVDGHVIGIAGSADDAEGIATLIPHLRQLYQDTAQIIPAMEADSMQSGLEPESIDLLIIDATRIDPLTEDDAAALIGCISQHGIIALVGGPADQDNAVALRLATKDWSTQHLCIGPGLTLFQRGGGFLNEPIFSSAGQNILRRIGEGLEAIAGRDAAAATLSRRNTELANADTSLKSVEARYSQLENAHKLQGHKLAVLESNLFDLQAENRDLASSVVALTDANDKSQEMADKLKLELHQYQTQSNDDKVRIAQQERERIVLIQIAEEMRAECTLLTGKMDDEHANTERKVNTASKQREDVEALKAALKKAKETARAENARRAALQASLSWRLTAPMRGLRSVFKRG